MYPSLTQREEVPRNLHSPVSRSSNKVLPELPGLLTKISCPEIYDAFTNKRADIFRKVK
jgi:hypothetical protein